MLLFSNNAEATLAEPLTGDHEDPDFNTIEVVADGTEESFDSPSAGNSQLATLTHPSLPGEWEIVRITKRQINTFTVERGFESPHDAPAWRAWPVGAKLSARITAATLQAFPQLRDGRFLIVENYDGGDPYFSLGSLPAMAASRAKPTNGYYTGQPDRNFAMEIVGRSQPVDLGVAPTWESNGYYTPRSIVVPTVADGFQYWFDPASDGARSQTAAEPEFGGPLEEPTPALNGSTPVGFWVATPQPVSTELHFLTDAVVSEVGFIATSVDAVTVAPVISIGDGVDPGRYADEVSLSGIVSNSGPQIQRIPIAAGGALTNYLSFSVDTPAVGGPFQGWFYWRGFFLDVSD